MGQMYGHSIFKKGSRHAQYDEVYRRACIAHATRVQTVPTVYHMSSGWFDCTEPSLATSLQGKQAVQGAHAIVRGSSSTANLIEPTRNHIITEIARCREVCHRSSGWFDFTEPSLRTSLQGKQGVKGAYAIVRGGSSTSNLIEPTRTTTSQR